MLALERGLGLPLELSSIGSRQKGELGKRACLTCLRDRKKVRIARGSIVNEREGGSK